ncbi:MAG: UpxY family transcription antiterminator [Bacteroidota bacterium]|uniref:Transcription antitermination factor NusG n=1 Tax=Salegentibacter flavus TaxID=287099 RepID=A0A1I5BPK0_9FLAO|nr:UpxY family transcription antiterminator [Salegentibacter flavus]SFN76590.1 Transcription antitermination factor NusG [Salegentibacter flavus]
MLWYVLYTKPRSEQKVAQRLEKTGIQVYCPIITEVRKWSDRKKKVSTPLFKSYVFVKLPEKERNRVFDVPGVVHYMHWLGKPAVVRNHEIETIEKWLNNDEVDQIEINEISPGDKLVISKGSLEGREAIVREVGKKQMRLILPGMGFTVVVNTREVL